MKNLPESRKKTTGTARAGLKTALCEALFSYVMDKTRIFPKGIRSRYLLWANY